MTGAAAAAAVGAAAAAADIKPDETKAAVIAEAKQETKPADAAEKKPAPAVPETAAAVSEPEAAAKDEALEMTAAEPQQPEAHEDFFAETQPEEEMPPVFVFERDAGIVFEYAAAAYEPYEPRISPLTEIPRLESVNASEYNKMIEQLHKEQYQPRPEPKPAPEPEPMPAPQPQPAQEKIGFYNGVDSDGTLDPFAPGSGEMTYDELEKKNTVSFGQRLKKSFGKIFKAADGEDE